MTQINDKSKLIAITHKDLKPGYQAVQASHAAIEFIFEHPEIAHDWYNISKYLVFLSVKNLDELVELSEKLSYKGIKHSKFYEPDIGNELTAIALEPTSKARKLVSSYPLLLKDIQEGGIQNEN